MKKRVSCIALALLICFVSLHITRPIVAEAATTGSSYIVNVYDMGQNYSGRYERDRDFGNFKAGAFGKSFTIQFCNVYSQLSNSEVSFFKTYARFQVYVYNTNGKLVKFYGNKKIGNKFSIPRGTYNIVIHSGIDSSGWNRFAANRWHYTYAQYRLKY